MNGPIPSRVTAADKHQLIGLVDDAVADGWPASRACSILGLDRRRLWAWQHRQLEGRLDDAASGGRPIHGLLDSERALIIELFEEWGDVDRSHRKLAHRGSYQGLVWVSPSTVDRVLHTQGLLLPGLTRPPKSEKQPWPDWCEWKPNQLWCWDASQFTACLPDKYAYAIVDLVSRLWVATILTAAPDSVAAQVLFTKALEAEGLLTEQMRARIETGILPEDLDGVPLLVAVSDNGTEMRANTTRVFMAACSIAQHFGRKSTPTDQAWIESLWGHIKGEHPHLLSITEPAVLATELERIRIRYNTVRLHQGIGYVTPDDEHHGRGDSIRQARIEGLKHADRTRREWHRQQQSQP